MLTWMLLQLSRFSRVRLCATPRTAAHQAALSLGVSRHEHWSGLPFPSPRHESEKWKWSHSIVSDSSWLHGPHAAYQAPLSMGFSRQEYWSGVPLPSPVSMNNAPQFLKMLGQKENNKQEGSKWHLFESLNNGKLEPIEMMLLEWGNIFTQNKHTALYERGLPRLALLLPFFLSLASAET